MMEEIKNHGHFDEDLQMLGKRTRKTTLDQQSTTSAKSSTQGTAFKHSRKKAKFDLSSNTSSYDADEVNAD